jgi:hypothetical protein
MIFLSCLPAFGACGNGFHNCISHTLPTLAATITDYMYLVNRTDAHLAVTPNGLVQHMATQYDGQTVSADDIFTSDAGCALPLRWQFELPTTTLGARIVHVRIPTATSGLVIWECYNSSASTWQGGTASQVWPAAYFVVAHLSDINSGCIITCTTADSTSNGNNGTYLGSAGVASATGITGGAISLPGAGVVDVAFPAFNQATFTAEVWVWSATLNSQTAALMSSDDFPQWLTQVSSGTNAYFNSAFLTFTTPSNSNWHQIVQKGVGTTGTLYIDGVNVVSGAITAQTLTATSLNLGASHALGQPFGGLEDEFRVSSLNMSDAQVSAEWGNYGSTSTWATVSSEQSATSAVRRRIIQ